jgi:hypothetical protein
MREAPVFGQLLGTARVGHADIAGIGQIFYGWIAPVGKCCVTSRRENDDRGPAMIAGLPRLERCFEKVVFSCWACCAANG